MSSENINNLAGKNEFRHKSEVYDLNEDEGNLSNITLRMRFGSILRTWADVSKINYFSAIALGEISREQRLRSFRMSRATLSVLAFENAMYKNLSDELSIEEQFPVHMTSLMNEDQYWGCFYIFPELYNDAYSPITRILNIQDVVTGDDGVLTRDMVTACLSYLKRIPILGDYVYIKLDLTMKYLINIEVLKYYKYIVYLDLSSNQLTDLQVLSNLLYLQYLAVDYNRLERILDYDPPQWFLTEVHYKYNLVMGIQNLWKFWSITVLDLSHNNIKYIDGLQELSYLRRLDLSFNHIQRIENLNHLNLLWLDLSYNKIWTYEISTETGLWTLLHLEYLNLNENNLTTFKIFTGCTRLRELHVRNNDLNLLLELAVYMRQLRRLTILDLRSNPVCKVKGYSDVIINTFPLLLNFDGAALEPIAQRTSKMDMNPDVMTFATRRLLRLLYIQQLSKAKISPYVPPADNFDVPIVVLVGYEAVGKGQLARRLASECNSNIELAIQHTTANYHFSDHYKVVTRANFDNMLLSGELLTYSEKDGESYGLSREQAFVKDGKVRIATMDLIGALMLKLRGFRPYLILASCLDKKALALRQEQRKIARHLSNEKRMSAEYPFEISTLQILLSGRIIINGILNEILQTITPENNDDSEFLFQSECSLSMNTEMRHKPERIDLNRLTVINPSLSTIEDNKKTSSAIESSLYSVYNETRGIGEYISDVCHQAVITDKTKRTSEPRFTPRAEFVKNQECQKYSTTWKGLYATQCSRNTSKSVTFNSPENTDILDQEPDTSGLLIRSQPEMEMQNILLKSLSANVTNLKSCDSDLCLAFLLENKFIQTSDISAEHEISGQVSDDSNNVAMELSYYDKLPPEIYTTTIRDEYEDIHRQCPGLFWDTVTMDDPDAAFKKVKTIIRSIVNNQKDLKPMFDIDFANNDQYTTVQKKLGNICHQIAGRRLFY